MTDFTGHEDTARLLERQADAHCVKQGAPALVVGILHPGRSLGKTVRMRPEHPFVRVRHQTAGLACHSVEIEGIILQPRPRVLAAMQLIERHWYDSCMGAIQTSLDEILHYRMQLRDLVHPLADCNRSYMHLEEGLYPLDVHVGVLRDICENTLPDDLDDLLDFDSSLARAIGALGRWSCFILAENSD